MSTFSIPAACPTTVQDGTTYWVQTQQAPSTDTWSPLESIVFTTSLAILAEETSPPNQLGLGNNRSASRNFIPAMTDMVYPLTGGAMDYMGCLSYSPVAEYRWSTLLASADLKNLNFAVYWKCRYNAQLYPVSFTADGGGSISVKLLLEKTADDPK